MTVSFLPHLRYGLLEYEYTDHIMQQAAFINTKRWQSTSEGVGITDLSPSK